MTQVSDHSSSTPYGSFAAAYDAGQERRFSEEMAVFALRTATDGLSSCTSVLDVACGIGAACEYFAARGLRTFGVDASIEMLDRARSAAEERGCRIEYLNEDMRQLSVTSSVDLVTCMYDSLNFMPHITDLGRAFHQARQVLRAGGYYIFDMYTPRGLADAWGNADQIHTVHSDHFVATRTAWDPTELSSTKTLWGFQLTDGHWHSWQEVHTIHAYPIAEIEGALCSNGFRLCQTLDWTAPSPGPISELTTRAVFVAVADMTEDGA